MKSVEDAQRQTAEYRFFFRLMSEGLQERSIKEFKAEMEGLALCAMDEALRKAARRAMGRYDEKAPSPPPPVSAANSA
jgi:hypothetical protein